MRSIPTEKLIELRGSGSSVRLGKALTAKKRSEGNAPVEKALDNLTSAVKNVKLEDKSAKLILQSSKKIAAVLLKTSDKLKECSKVTQWDITVVRGKNKLIKTLKLKAVK